MLDALIPIVTIILVVVIVIVFDNWRWQVFFREQERAYREQEQRLRDMDRQH